MYVRTIYTTFHLFPMAFAGAGIKRCCPMTPLNPDLGGKIMVFHYSSVFHLPSSVFVFIFGSWLLESSSGCSPRGEVDARRYEIKRRGIIPRLRLGYLTVVRAVRRSWVRLKTRCDARKDTVGRMGFGSEPERAVEAQKNAAEARVAALRPGTAALVAFRPLIAPSRQNSWLVVCLGHHPLIPHRTITVGIRELAATILRNAFEILGAQWRVARPRAPQPPRRGAEIESKRLA
ncbi:hypothetical protein DFH09DRAFT_1068502 [Mycena vulgaris]|nr:hypothetical protein DFH09DRAFT_1068502 [Mycena vulgaris]